MSLPHFLAAFSFFGLFLTQFQEVIPLLLHPVIQQGEKNVFCSSCTSTEVGVSAGSRQPEEPENKSSPGTLPLPRGEGGPRSARSPGSLREAI